MKRYLSHNLRFGTGFTLVELLLVLLLIGLLAGIAAPLYLGRAETARVQKVEADLATLATALSLYRLDNHQLPNSEQGLGALVERSRLAPLPQRFKPGGYIRNLPLDPWGQPYRYLSPGRESGSEYDLWSTGADARPGGSGADADIYF